MWPHPQACRKPRGLWHSEFLPPRIAPGLEAHPLVLHTQAPISPETTSPSHFSWTPSRPAGGQQRRTRSDTKRGATWGIPGMVVNQALTSANCLPCFQGFLPRLLPPLVVPSTEFHCPAPLWSPLSLGNTPIASPLSASSKPTNPVPHPLELCSPLRGCHLTTTGPQRMLKKYPAPS